VIQHGATIRLRPEVQSVLAEARAADKDGRMQAFVEEQRADSRESQRLMALFAGDKTFATALRAVMDERDAEVGIFPNDDEVYTSDEEWESLTDAEFDRRYKERDDEMHTLISEGKMDDDEATEYCYKQIVRSEKRHRQQERQYRQQKRKATKTTPAALPAAEAAAAAAETAAVHVAAAAAPPLLSASVPARKKSKVSSGLSVSRAAAAGGSATAGRSAAAAAAAAGAKRKHA
jgi:uncharacterized protein YhaN